MKVPGKVFFPQSALGYAQCLHHSTGLAEGSSSYFSGDAGCLWKGSSLSQDPQPGSRAFRSPDYESDFSLSVFPV